MAEEYNKIKEGAMWTNLESAVRRFQNSLCDKGHASTPLEYADPKEFVELLKKKVPGVHVHVTPLFLGYEGKGLYKLVVAVLPADAKYLKHRRDLLKPDDES